MLGAASCVFLMYYLAADTWWRFIGWLVLGLSIYLAYGYTRSAIGMRLGRPSRTPPILKLASLGFFALAVGLFTVPHNIGFLGVFDAAFTAGDPNHGRALVGVLLIFVGFVLGAVGSIMVATTSQPTDKAE
jgi:APA family basic amino acid/polyamine antiporter